MAVRLSDSELAARIRAGNRQRAQRQLEKRRAAGLVQLNVWLSQSTREALDKAAAANNETVSDTVEKLLSASLAAAAPLARNGCRTVKVRIKSAAQPERVVNVKRIIQTDE